MPAARCRSPLAVALVATLAATAAAQPTQSVWEASSGLLPTQVCPPWTLVDAGSADPAFGAEGLTLATQPGEDMLFVQTGFDVLAPDPFVAEARVRFVSGSSSASNRAPIAIVVTVSSDTGAFLGIGADEIFLTAAGDVRGQSATVDTDGAPHTYRLEITSGGAVTVLYDGVSTLTGTTFTNASAFGSETRIIWGEGASQASGTQVWQSFKHNAISCPGGTTTTTTTVLPPTTVAPTTTLATVTTTSSTVPPGPSTTSTTNTTVTPGSTTTTTLAPAGCDDVRPGSLAALGCRLAVLEGQIANADGLGQFRAKLESTLEQAIARTDQALAACDAGDRKTANRRMKQTAKFLQKMAHRLSGLSARRKLDPILRADLAEVIGSIRSDATARRRNACEA